MIYTYTVIGDEGSRDSKGEVQGRGNTFTLLFVPCVTQNTLSPVPLTLTHINMVQGKQAGVQEDLYKETKTAFRRKPGNTMEDEEIHRRELGYTNKYSTKIQ